MSELEKAVDTYVGTMLRASTQWSEADIKQAFREGARWLMARASVRYNNWAGVTEDGRELHYKIVHLHDLEKLMAL